MKHIKLTYLVLSIVITFVINLFLCELTVFDRHRTFMTAIFVWTYCFRSPSYVYDSCFCVNLLFSIAIVCSWQLFLCELTVFDRHRMFMTAIFVWTYCFRSPSYVHDSYFCVNLLFSIAIVCSWQLFLCELTVFDRHRMFMTAIFVWTYCFRSPSYVHDSYFCVNLLFSIAIVCSW